LAVDEEFKGDLAIVAHAEGPLAGPKEQWSVREGRVRTKDARFRSIKVDEAEVVLGSGSLAEISFKGKARGGADEVQAEGLFRWPGKQPDIEAAVKVGIADVAPYLTLLKLAPLLKCKDVRAEGKLLIHAADVSYDGAAAIGAGDYAGLKWEKAEFKGSLAADRLEARELLITNSSFAASLNASGKLEGETLSLKFSSDGDQGVLGGRFNRETGDFEGRLRLEGPMAWLNKAFGLP